VINSFFTRNIEVVSLLEIWWALPAQLSGRAIDCRSIGLRRTRYRCANPPSLIFNDACPVKIIENNRKII
ncbi:hypothetical protein H8356DRAFT_1333315, partial [Neocallimastix lanati (nom. inval.)]